MHAEQQLTICLSSQSSPSPRWTFVVSTSYQGESEAREEEEGGDGWRLDRAGLLSGVSFNLHLSEWAGSTLAVPPPVNQITFHRMSANA